MVKRASRGEKDYRGHDVILVEGFGDVDFFTRFFEHRLGKDITEHLYFADEEIAKTRAILLASQGGEPKIKTTLKTTLKNLSVAMPQSLFVIIDRDGKENRFTDYQTLFKNSLYKIDIPEVNQVVSCVIENQTVAFGIFMIGDETTPYQYLEGLLYETRREKGVSHEKLVQQCVALLPQDSQSVDKSKVAVYLASLPKWSNTLGFALEKEWTDEAGKNHLGYFNADHPEFERIFGKLIAYLKNPEAYFSNKP